MRIAGFRLTVDPLLPVVIGVIAWLLASRYVPNVLPRLDFWTTMAVGGLASLLLTVSILIHEFGHAWMARRLRLSIERIHLFLFGGMAELKHRPITARQEALVALAGPSASLLLGLLGYAAYHLLVDRHPYPALLAHFIGQMNLMLALFNLIPIFPLDGGRAVRAGFWRLIGRYADASRATMRLSHALILLFAAGGFLDLFIWKSDYTLVLFLLSGYLGYTVWTGRHELLHIPTLEELISNPDDLPDWTVGRMVRVEVDETGRPTEWHVPEGAEPGLTHVDLSDRESWYLTDAFAADVVPVLRDGRLAGMADPYELRFWLREHPIES